MVLILRACYRWVVLHSPVITAVFRHTWTWFLPLCRVCSDAAPSVWGQAALCSSFCVCSQGSGRINMGVLSRLWKETTKKVWAVIAGCVLHTGWIYPSELCKCPVRSVLSSGFFGATVLWGIHRAQWPHQQSHGALHGLLGKCGLPVEETTGQFSGPSPPTHIILSQFSLNRK